MDYAWKDGARTHGLDIDKVTPVLDAIVERDGVLTPAAILAAAKGKRSPIHRWFEWDDTEAAKKYREVQAREMVRSIVVTVTQADQEEVLTVRAFVHMAEPNTYEPIMAVLAEADSRDALLGKALAELQAFQAKYATLSSLAEVFAAARTTRKRHKERTG